ncbi:MAG: DNA repair protein [Muribaculaceae bacterium]|nr:DNA repair protein [Muribaculaceae bacterium]
MHGSVWRKWDLHVHTPESGMANEYSCNWDEYVVTLFRRAIEEDVAVIGITDYFTIDGYKKLRQEYIENEEKLSSLFTASEIAQIKGIRLFPNIEFRLEQIVNKNRINYHVLFSDKVKIEDIEDNFLHEIEFVNEAEPSSSSNKRKLKKRNLEDLGASIKKHQPEFNESDFTVGCTTAVVSAKEIEEILHKHKDLFSGNYLIIVPVDEDLSKISWNSQGHMVRKYFYQSANVFFATNTNTIEFGLGKRHESVNKFIEEFKSLKPCICGSDAHKLESLFMFPNGKSCWIKADPSFEGLKQIIYEPEERVKLQTAKPDEKNLYQVLESIVLNEPDFWSGTIYLNPNLNTIIGGRSTGKSSLLKAIAAKHDALKEADDYILQHLKGISIHWADGGNEEGHKIDYYSQGYMHKIASSQKLTNELVETILKSKDDLGLLVAYSDKKSQIEREITSDIFNLFQLRKEFLELFNSLKEKGNKTGVEQQINLLKSKVVELQKNSALTSEEIASFNGLQSQLASNDKEMKAANDDVLRFQHLRTLSPIVNNFENSNSLGILAYRNNATEIIRLFQGLRTRTEEEWQSIVDKMIADTMLAKEKLVSQQEIIMASQLYKRGSQFYKDNKELQSLLARVKEEEKVLSEIIVLESKTNSLKQQSQKLIANIVSNHLKYKETIEHLIDVLKVEYDGLSITVIKDYNGDKMKFFLENRCNLRSSGRTQYIADMVSNYPLNTKKVTEDFLRDLVNGRIELKNSYTPQGVANEFFTQEWFSVSYQLKYQNDLFGMMSEGKQAFVILKLLLEFSNKKCPILIDQPEDSLDNRAIYQELVEYIKSKKKERQIILVTHNSNVVVSADAENVIVANQNGVDCNNDAGCKFQYINGSLESTQKKNLLEKIILKSQGVREHVCEILEGGRTAFEKRERKYGFKG